ncbi:hypothetical protein L1049_000086 [Liquidambar formosana]|uniref:RIN4 pathogenic type III effector avirulence factor Avr cleavage site domain-containing protein n=1 Tax=Liquidambar formosana TaxID=63359 RepID=A0AAP0N861_LIQFO
MDVIEDACVISRRTGGFCDSRIWFLSPFITQSLLGTHLIVVIQAIKRMVQQTWMLCLEYTILYAGKKEHPFMWMQVVGMGCEEKARKHLSREFMSQDNGRPLPKFGDWDVNDPASAEGFTVIFNKARDEKKTGGKAESPEKVDPSTKHGMDPGKPPQAKKWFCCIQAPNAES